MNGQILLSLTNRDSKNSILFSVAAAPKLFRPAYHLATNFPKLCPPVSEKQRKRQAVEAPPTQYAWCIFQSLYHARETITTRDSKNYGKMWVA